MGFFILLMNLQPQSWANTERSEFFKAENAIAKGNYQPLKHHVMRPYLAYKDLLKNFNKTSHKEITAFLTEYKKSPYPAIIKYKWFDLMASRKNWKQVIRYYKKGKNVRRQCYYLQALLATNQKTKAFNQVKNLWKIGKSQPKACDIVFKQWIDAKKLTPALVWQRIDSAFAYSKIGLVKYLRRYLNNKDKKTLDKLVQIYQNPKTIDTITKLKLPEYRKNQIRMVVVKRLYYKSHKEAVKLWLKLQQKHQFSSAEQGGLDAWLIRRIYDEENDVVWQFIKQSKPWGDKGKAAKVRAALVQKDWTKVLTWINQLSATEQQNEVWLYWQGRALEEQGKTEHAKWYYQKLAKKRDYYGFLSADKLGKPYQFNHKKAFVDAKIKKQLASRASFKRAMFLFSLDRNRDAKREWYYASRNLSKHQLYAAAQLAKDIYWDFQVISMLSKAKYWNDVEKRFPTAFLEAVKKQAKNNGLDPAWVYGIIRQESAFDYLANSSVGASGLMQLMPATARRVAKMLKLPISKAKEITKPLVNIQFGTKYLAHAYDKLQSQPVLATAGYNAGPHRVKKWLKQRSNMPADLWVELIPYSETRKYVKRVMTYATIYEFFKLKNNKTTITQRMSTIAKMEK